MICFNRSGLNKAIVRTLSCCTIFKWPIQSPLLNRVKLYMEEVLKCLMKQEKRSRRRKLRELLTSKLPLKSMI